MTRTEQALAHAVAAIAALNGQYAIAIAEAAEMFERMAHPDDQPDAILGWLSSDTVLHARDVVGKEE